MNKENFIDQFVRIRDDVENFLFEGPVSESEILREKIYTEVDPLLNVEKPKVMVYGIYNSGKSTLINALCKEEIAEVADRPMTSSIQEYDNGDYILVDSPGVDAPIEHEMITESYLSKCHIILFVMSTKGIFEDQSNYKRMTDLINRGIPFVIVLNDKGYSVKKSDSEEQRKIKAKQHEQEINDIKHKVIHNLRKYSNDAHFFEKYDMVEVNAKRGINGVLKNSEKLYRNSKVEQLNNRIYQILSNKDSLKIYHQPLNNLQAILLEIKGKLQIERLGFVDKNFEKSIGKLNALQLEMCESMRIASHEVVYNYLGETTRVIRQQKQENFDEIKHNILLTLKERYESKCIELSSFINSYFKDLDIKVNTRLSLVGESQTDFSDALTESEKKWIVPKIKEYSRPEISQPVLSSESEKRSILGELVGMIFGGRQKKEDQKYKELVETANYRNQEAELMLDEETRRYIDSRNLAVEVLDKLIKDLSFYTTQEINAKFNELLSCIEDKNSQNQNEIKEVDNRIDRVCDFIDKVNCLYVSL